MTDKEIQDGAQKHEDALSKHREGEISNKLGADSSCHSKDDYKKLVETLKDMTNHDGGKDDGLPSMDITHVSKEMRAAQKAEEIAAALTLGAIVESFTPPDPVENHAAIANGDNVAGRVNNTTVVSDADVGALKGALGSIDGSTAAGQFAIARVQAALNAAEGKVAAGRSAGAGGDYAGAQQFGSPEAYAAYKRAQAEKETGQEQQFASVEDYAAYKRAQAEKELPEKKVE
jgi:hypothetical protein